MRARCAQGEAGAPRAPAPPRARLAWPVSIRRRRRSPRSRAVAAFVPAARRAAVPASADGCGSPPPPIPRAPPWTRMLISGASDNSRMPPELSVAVATHERPLRLRWLLNALDEQTLDRSLWEVVVAYEPLD